MVNLMSISFKSSPLDTGWDQFQKDDLKRTPSRYSHLLRELEERASRFHLDPYMVTLAAEQVRFNSYIVKYKRNSLHPQSSMNTLHLPHILTNN